MHASVPFDSAGIGAVERIEHASTMSASDVEESNIRFASAEVGIPPGASLSRMESAGESFRQRAIRNATAGRLPFRSQTHTNPRFRTAICFAAQTNANDMS